jgi:phage tail-like protein
MSSDLYTSGRFYIFIDKAPKAVFISLSGLQVETDVMEYAEGGNNGFVHQLPGRTRVGRITLKRGVSRSDELFKWYTDIAYGKKFERKNVSVVMYNEAGEELRRWNFVNAYPVRWVGPDFESGSTATAIETLELAHDGLQA